MTRRNYKTHKLDDINDKKGRCNQPALNWSFEWDDVTCETCLALRCRTVERKR